MQWFLAAIFNKISYKSLGMFHDVLAIKGTIKFQYDSFIQLGLEEM